MVSKGRAAIAGVVAAAVALGVAEVVAALIAPRYSPLLAVGGAVVDLSPGPAKEFAIELFGVYDKIVLLVGTTVLLAGFAALIGLAARRDIRWGVAGIGLFAAIGIAAALTRHDATWLAILPTAIGCVAAAFALVWLISPASFALHPSTQSEEVASLGAEQKGAESTPGQAPGAAGTAWGGAAGSAWRGSAGDTREAMAGESHEAMAGEGPQRRSFLKWAAGLAGLAAVAGIAGRWWGGRLTVEAAQRDLVLPSPANPAPALPASIDPPVSGLASYVTSNDDFYLIDTTFFAPPQVDPATWTLRIHGRVRNPITLTFEQLMARPMVERYITLACVSNEVGGELIGNARWLGVPVKDLLDEADPLPGADQVVSRSVDGWTCGTPTSVLRDGRDALLAVGMNGEALPISHGFPVRMVTPGLYGYVSACKWIKEIELTSFAEFDAYWVKYGWAEQGLIKTQSRIDTPRHRAKVQAGRVMLAGVAWAQHRGITTVEVSTDGGGTWRQADLNGVVSFDTWRQWTLAWDATPGTYTLVVRAADATGTLQSQSSAPPKPDGAEGWHTITVTVT